LEVRLSFGHSNSIPTTPVVSRIFDGVIFMDESRLERRLAATLSADVGDHSRRYTDAGLIRQWARSIGLAAAVGIAYFLAARLSLLLLTKPDGVAVF